MAKRSRADVSIMGAAERWLWLFLANVICGTRAQKTYGSRNLAARIAFTLDEYRKERINQQTSNKVS